jgi:7-carboxy-7-deazaguanine synthase
LSILKVVEKFVSINGEGLRAGELAVFIRFYGCNLHCSYCDTKWANEGFNGEEMSPTEIVEYIKSTGIKNVTLTGGEPLLAENIAELLKLLSAENELSTEIETNGSVDFRNLKADNIVFTVDVKCPSSGMCDKNFLKNLTVLDINDAVKFVVSDENDLEFALKIITEYKLTEKTNVILSPVFGEIAPVEIVIFMTENKLNGVRLGIQLHKIIWDPAKRGV